MTKPADYALEALTNALRTLDRRSRPKSVQDLVAAIKNGMRDAHVVCANGDWELEDLAVHPVVFVASSCRKYIKRGRRQHHLPKWGSSKGWKTLRTNIPSAFESYTFERTHRKRQDKQYRASTTRVDVGPGLCLFAVVCDKWHSPITNNAVVPTPRPSETPTPTEFEPDSAEVTVELTTDEVLSESGPGSSTPTPKKRKRELVIEPGVKKSKKLDGKSSPVIGIDFEKLADKLDIMGMIEDVLGDDDTLVGYPVPETEMTPFKSTFTSATIRPAITNHMVKMSFPTWSPYGPGPGPNNPMYDISDYLA